MVTSSFRLSDINLAEEGEVLILKKRVLDGFVRKEGERTYCVGCGCNPTCGCDGKCSCDEKCSDRPCWLYCSCVGNPPCGSDGCHCSGHCSGND